MSDIFVDRFVKFNISQGVARLDFARLEEIDAEKKEMRLSPSSRLVMPVDSFAHFVDQLVKVKAELQKRAADAEESSDMATTPASEEPAPEEKH
jgi:hypothetical protein